MLGREAVELDLPSIASYITGSTVLVTGAGGSIGSELCRQVAALGAEPLILVDHSESALVEIERELATNGGSRRPCRRSRTSRTPSKMQQLFERYRPTVVFHAAAYKHVPLMEANPLESVRNNVFGTQVLAEAGGRERRRALRARLHRQGGAADERPRPDEGVCEWVVGRPPRGAERDEFIAVRFGNVLGSSGASSRSSAARSRAEARSRSRIRTWRATS